MKHYKEKKEIDEAYEDFIANLFVYNLGVDEKKPLKFKKLKTKIVNVNDLECEEDNS